MSDLMLMLTVLLAVISGRHASAALDRAVRVRVVCTNGAAALAVVLLHAQPGVALAAATLALASAAGLAWRLPLPQRTWGSDIGEAVVILVAVVAGLQGQLGGVALVPVSAAVSAGWAVVGAAMGLRLGVTRRAAVAIAVTPAGVLVGAAGLGDAVLGASMPATEVSLSAVITSGAVVLAAWMFTPVPPSLARLGRRVAMAVLGGAVVTVAALVSAGAEPLSWLLPGIVAAVVVDWGRPAYTAARRSRWSWPRNTDPEPPEPDRETLMLIQRLTDPLAAQHQVVRALDDLFPGGRFELLRGPNAPRGLPAAPREIDARLLDELVRRGSLFHYERDSLSRAEAASFAALGGTLLLPVVFDETMYGALLVHYDDPKTEVLVQARRFADLLASKLEIHRLYSELEQKQRLATLGTFSAALLHDLRSPLSTIRLDLQMLERSGNERSRAALGSAIRAVDRVLVELSGTLDYTRPLELDVEVLDVASVVEQVVQGYGADAMLVVHAERGLPRVRGDAARLRRVFDNILRNALEAAPPGSEVRVDVELHDQGIEVRVTDRGEGIDESMRERIFEPFVSTKAHGVGLGLAIVKKIVDCHRGMVQIDRLDHGTCARVWLPLSP